MQNVNFSVQINPVHSIYMCIHYIPQPLLSIHSWVSLFMHACALMAFKGHADMVTCEKDAVWEAGVSVCVPVFKSFQVS